jgi:antitoxin PrlF
MSKVTREGRVTLPKRIRDELGLVPGSKVEFKVKDGHVVLLKRVSVEKLVRWQGYLRGKLPEDSVDNLVDELRGQRR